MHVSSQPSRMQHTLFETFCADVSKGRVILFSIAIDCYNAMDSTCILNFVFHSKYRDSIIIKEIKLYPRSVEVAKIMVPL